MKAGTVLKAGGLPAALADTPDAVLAKYTDASAATSPVAAPVYLTGEFQKASLVYSDGAVTDAAVAKLRALSIFAKTAI